MTFKRMIIIPLFILTSAVAAQSAVEVPNARAESDDKINVFQMKRKLQDQTKDIQRLTKEVANVEVTLGMNNKKYLQLAEERAKIEERLASARRNADFDSETLKKSYAQTKSLLMGVLLNKLENTERSSDMLARKIMIEGLQKKLVDLNGMMSSNKDLQGNVDSLYAKLQESMDTEKELLSVMGELEERKRTLRESLNSQTKSSEDARIRLDEEKNKLAMNQKSVQREKAREKLAPVQITEEIKIPSQPLSEDQFRAPIASYQNMEYQKKGVTYNFHGKNEIRAPRGGKVVYTGALANYGNVLMIDHGNDTRTVLLGQFDYAVKNGDAVKEFQVVGHTNPRSNNGLGEGRIYFEVRKNNLAQNTYLLLDKKSRAASSN
ncbi:peptidoglycan DD-metalloendopeptidase family protein [Bacteriovorax sp. PP10]|uniref:Peptidoglycan DD-metalloendopeptidase family protein n=1 Tax=Bacteriovorax antarcticus TaxID=3088717 RepID=A0ABU5VRB1_9BACT|nr:peptidoglycan DD-metalloendopeptidase family protein [Bacteriovorax sp. PP10]MEA9355585.1 peptidoglycan DD-metalloendopeptidase family protein [Bacteriovorax sp. PP10]